MSEVEHVLAVQNNLGEGPLWHAEEQALYWVDIEERQIHRFHPDSGAHKVFTLDIPVGAVAFREGGGFVLATRDGFAYWDGSSSSLDFIADPEPGKPGARFNDGKVDPQGRFWAGTMAEGASSSLYRLDPDGSVHTMIREVTIANGIGWSPDAKTMYFTDTLRYTIDAYDFDQNTGTITNRRPFVHDDEEAGYPDGLAVDSEGFVWSARIGAWKVIRYDPTGAVEREIRLPVKNPSSCIFGGRHLDELYITTAWMALGDGERRQQPYAGDLFRLRTGIKGLEVHKFAG
jgi:sugar lactone lactonase YvrE